MGYVCIHNHFYQPPTGKLWLETLERKREGMRPPETAVDMESPDIPAQFGIEVTILAPRQAKRVRKTGGRNWSLEAIEGAALAQTG